MSPEVPGSGPEVFERLLGDASSRLGLSLTPAARRGISVYLAELDRWRSRINLTGPLSSEELAEHALESVVGTSLIADGIEVIDIGSGAGFPAVPIAISRPDLSMSMVEPRGKKVAFLKHVCRRLDLSRAEVLASELAAIDGRTWDVATTRAVGKLASVVGEGRFLTPGGLLLVWTTHPARLSAELDPAFRLESTVPIPGSEHRAVAAFRRN